jgi:hypothetical protein
MRTGTVPTRFSPFSKKRRRPIMARIRARALIATMLYRSISLLKLKKPPGWEAPAVSLKAASAPSPSQPLTLVNNDEEVKEVKKV